MGKLRLRFVSALWAGTIAAAGPMLVANANASTQAPQLEPVGTQHTYKVVDGRELHLWVLDNSSTTTPRAAVIFLHGGGWTANAPSQFNTHASVLAQAGMVSIEVEYRLLSERDPKASPRICVEDSKTAIRWVRSHAAQLGVDPNRIAVAGGSVGGYTAAFAAFIPRWNAPGDDLRVSARPDALVLLNPTVDNSSTGWGRERYGEDWSKYSPLEQVTKGGPPTLIMSGSADVVVPPATLKQFNQRLLAAGNRSNLEFYEGQPHAFFNKEPYTSRTAQRMIRFFKDLGFIG